MLDRNWVGLRMLSGVKEVLKNLEEHQLQMIGVKSNTTASAIAHTHTPTFLQTSQIDRSKGNGFRCRS